MSTGQDRSMFRGQTACRPETRLWKAASMDPATITTRFPWRAAGHGAAASKWETRWLSHRAGSALKPVLPASAMSNGRLSASISSFCCRRRSEEHTSELQSRGHLVCRLLLEKKKESIYNVQ